MTLEKSVSQKREGKFETSALKKKEREKLIKRILQTLENLFFGRKLNVGERGRGGEGEIKSRRGNNSEEKILFLSFAALHPFLA